MLKPYLEAGEFTTTHGITGELRLYPWADDATFLTRFHTLYLNAEGTQKLHAAAIRPHKNICIVKLEGVDSIEDARKYIGKTVFIARADAGLAPGVHFIQDLLGAAVVDNGTGEVYGRIATITHPGRHDVYEIERPDGSSVLFPAAPPFIANIDIEKSEVRVLPIEGMFTEDAAPGPAPKPRDGKDRNR